MDAIRSARRRQRARAARSPPVSRCSPRIAPSDKRHDELECSFSAPRVLNLIPLIDSCVLVAFLLSTSVEVEVVQNLQGSRPFRRRARRRSNADRGVEITNDQLFVQAFCGQFRRDPQFLNAADIAGCVRVLTGRC